MRLFPFSAIVGQELMKKGLLVNAVDPSIGGVLIRGEKGTGKTTAGRAFASVLRSTERGLGAGSKRLEMGVWGKANGNLLYIDEVNLLDDHVVDVLLDVAVSGRNVVMREGGTYSHPSRLILVGTMNPEGGGG